MFHFVGDNTVILIQDVESNQVVKMHWSPTKNQLVYQGLSNRSQL